MQDDNNGIVFNVGDKKSSDRIQYDLQEMVDLCALMGYWLRLFSIMVY